MTGLYSLHHFHDVITCGDVLYQVVHSSKFHNKCPGRDARRENMNI